MTENFDAKAALIGELFKQQQRDAETIKKLERELEDAFRFIGYLIARYGTHHENDPMRRIVRVDPFELMDAPTTVFRWDSRVADEVWFGVKLNE